MSCVTPGERPLAAVRQGTAGEPSPKPVGFRGFLHDPIEGSWDHQDARFDHLEPMGILT